MHMHVHMHMHMNMDMDMDMDMVMNMTRTCTCTCTCTCACTCACAQARDLAVPKQERSHEQMGDMLALFDKYDAQAKHRKRLLPGAPLPPDPRLATTEQGGYTADAAQTHDDHPGYPPAHRTGPSSFAPPAVAPRADAAMAPSMASMHLGPPAAMRLRPNDAYAFAHAHQHAAAPDTGSSLRPDQVADVQYLASRARGRLGSGPLW